VQNKLKNFALLRGDMELMFKVAVPPACYGAMEIAALPIGGAGASMGATVPTGLLQSGVIAAVNCRQTDIHATINYAAADDVKLTLPFFWPYDYLENPWSTPPSGGVSNAW